MTLYEIDERWVEHTRYRLDGFIADVNDEYGVHGEGINSLVPLVPVEGLMTAAEWLATADYEAIKVVLVDAMMYGNNTAAHNSGAPRDYYEQEADWYLDQLKTATCGGNVN